MDFSTLNHITPIPQIDGPEPVCAIAYSPEFVNAFDYLRGVLKADERSEAAFHLTTVCLKLNPANYTVWHFRRRCLVALSSVVDGSGDGDDVEPTIDADKIEKDLEFADKLGGTNPKNYQLWYHRRALLEFRFKGETDEVIKVAREELEYVDKILGDDSKNYHAWSHRQWIMRTINNPQLWSSEIEYSHSKIRSDLRNNSAWHQRWFALHEGKVSSLTATASSRGGTILSLEKAREEASYALSGAKVDPFNESPWRYLIGVLMEQWRWAQRQQGDNNNTEEEVVAKAADFLREYIVNIRDMKQTWDDAQEQKQHKSSEDTIPMGPCPNLMSALVDLLEIFTEDKEFLTEARGLLGELVVEDPVRRKYWQKRANGITKLLTK